MPKLEETFEISPFTCLQMSLQTIYLSLPHTFCEAGFQEKDNKWNVQSKRDCSAGETNESNIGWVGLETKG